jgi:hypothetical protein
MKTPPPPLPDWVEAILDEEDDPLPVVTAKRRAALDSLPSDRKRLIAVVAFYGPVRVYHAVRLAVPNATREQHTALAASMANLAREGRIERIAPGLYDTKE